MKLETTELTATATRAGSRPESWPSFFEVTWVWFKNVTVYQRESTQRQVTRLVADSSLTVNFT